MPTPTADRLPRPLRLLLGSTLALALLAIPLTASAADKAAPAKTGGNSIADGFRSLGQQISDPKTPDRIKGHEQEFEKNVQGTRDQQRKSHPGEVRATDATDMANSPKMGGQGASKSTASAPKPKASATKVKKESNKAAAPIGASKGPPKAPPPPAVAPTK